MLSIAAALVTFFLKLAAWHLTGSVGLLSEALESLVNLAAAMLAEYFSGGIEGVLILVAAAGICWTSMERMFHPQPLNDVRIGIAFTIFAALINFVVARMLLRVGRVAHSVALEADALHLMTDVWTSVVVIIAVVLVKLTGWNRLDPILGMMIALHIVFTGVKLVRQSMMGLMDTALPEEEIKTIRAILARHAVEGIEYHALRTRTAGARRFMSVHLVVPGAWTVTRGHDLAEKIENEIRQKVQRITVTTHIEPLEDPVSWEDAELERPENRLH